MSADKKTGNSTTPDDVLSEQNNNFDSSPFTLTVLTVAIFLFAQLIIGVIVAAYAVLSGEGLDLFDRVTESNVNNFLLAFGYTVVQFLTIFGILKLQKKSLKSIGLIKPSLPDIPRAVTGFVIYFVLVLTAFGLLEALDAGVDLDQEQLLDFDRTTDTLGLVLVFFSLVVSPAFIEEVLMRGFLFMGLRKKLSFLQSTAIVSVLFGIAHLQFGSGEPLLWAGFVDTFVLSVVLCGLTEKFKTLWPAIFVHAIKNSIAFYVLFVR